MQVLREDHLRIGDVHVAAASDSLTMRGADQNAGEVRLDPEGVTRLLDFLRSVIISPNDRRGAYRVPIPATSGFRATLFLDAGSMTCAARDLSLTGVRVHPALPDSPGIKVGSTLKVLLEFDGESVCADATIVRRAGSEYGLSFLETEGDALPGVARMMRLLERFWVAEGWKS